MSRFVYSFLSLIICSFFLSYLFIFGPWIITLVVAYFWDIQKSLFNCDRFKEGHQCFVNYINHDVAVLWH